MQILYQIDDLRLHGDVERAHGLVGDEELRFRRERARGRCAVSAHRRLKKT